MRVKRLFACVAANSHGLPHSARHYESSSSPEGGGAWGTSGESLGAGRGHQHWRKHVAFLALRARPHTEAGAECAPHCFEVDRGIRTPAAPIRTAVVCLRGQGTQHAVSVAGLTAHQPCLLQTDKAAICIALGRACVAT